MVAPDGDQLGSDVLPFAILPGGVLQAPCLPRDKQSGDLKLKIEDCSG